MDIVSSHTLRSRGILVPRYFFVLEGPGDERHDDTEGTVLTDKPSAVAFANQIMGELKEAGGYDDPGWVLIVKDEAGQAIASVPFAKVDQLN
jgi:hypothetical protein